MDRKKLEDKNYCTNSNHKSVKKSHELYLLDHYSWFLLKNHDDISYTPYWRSVRGRGGFWFDPAQYEKEFLSWYIFIDPSKWSDGYTFSFLSDRYPSE